jgi:hypothetical protein
MKLSGSGRFGSETQMSLADLPIPLGQSERPHSHAKHAVFSKQKTHVGG